MDPTVLMQLKELVSPLGDLYFYIKKSLKVAKRKRLGFLRGSAFSSTSLHLLERHHVLLKATGNFLKTKKTVKYQQIFTLKKQTSINERRNSYFRAEFVAFT